MSEPRAHSSDGRLRRAADVLLSGAAFAALLPVFVVSAIAIKLDTEGPVIFSQERVGKAGRPFRILKFRSMIVGSERAGPKVSGTKDSRITKVGGFLRRTKLDEFPQLWNVLRGDMTLVGPRAEVPEMIQHYTPSERILLECKPGLTGPGQIFFTESQAAVLDELDDPEAYYVQHQLHEKLAIDLNYLRNRRWTTDMRVVWRTLLVILSPRRRFQRQ